jgi:hypothetical protein
MIGAARLLASTVDQNWRKRAMNGSRAKALRSLAKYSIKKTRETTLDKQYKTKEHIKFRTIKGAKVKFISYQVFTIGDRALYKFYKNAAKKGDRDVQ